MNSDSALTAKRLIAIFREVVPEDARYGAQARFAERLGLKQDSCSYVLKEERGLGSPNLRRIAETSGIQSTYFLSPDRPGRKPPHYRDFIEPGFSDPFPPGWLDGVEQTSAGPPSTAPRSRKATPHESGEYYWLDSLAEVLDMAEADGHGPATLRAMLAHLDLLRRVKTVTMADARAFLEGLRRPKQSPPKRVPHGGKSGARRKRSP